MMQKSRKVYLEDPRSGNWCKTNNSMKTWMRLKEMHGCLLRGFADFLGNHKAANNQDVVQDLLTSYKAMGCNMSLKIYFLESHLEFFHRKFWRSEWQTRWKISPRHYGYGKAVPRQVCCKTIAGHWRGMYLMPNTVESHMPQHFGGMFLPVSWAGKVRFCTFKFLCVCESLPDRSSVYISEFSIKSTAKFIYWSSWDKKKVTFCWSVYSQIGQNHLGQILGQSWSLAYILTLHNCPIW